MDCETFRYWSLVQLSPSDPAWQAHRKRCLSCAEYAHDIDCLNASIFLALKVPAPRNSTFAAPYARDKCDRKSPWLLSHWTPRLPALAAGLLLTIAGTTVWLQRNPTLVDAVEAHIAEHPLHSRAHDPTVGEKLQAIMKSLGGHLAGEFPNLVQANLCEIKGRRAAHLVFAGPPGRVSAIVIPGLEPTRQFEWTTDGQLGMLSPTDYGAIAIVGPEADTEWRAELDRLRDGIQF